MPQQTPTVLVADSSDDRRRRVGLALYEGGFEVINAVNSEEALRFTAGLDPELVVAHTSLRDVPPLELRQRLEATGLVLPPFLILYDDPSEIPEEPPEGPLYFLPATDLDPTRLLHQVRLLLLARDIGGELGDRIETLYGDLTRVSVGDLLRVLARHLISGHVALSVGTEEVGFWVEDGNVVHAHWGPARGVKAFNRIAGLRGGGFTLAVGQQPPERTVERDLATLVSEAVEERLEFDELLRKLPSLASRVEVVMGDAFFSTEFTPAQKDLLTKVGQTRNLGELIDRADATDADTARAVLELVEAGVLALHEPRQTIQVVTDSTCDLPRSLVRRLGITVVPLSVLFGREVFKDGIDLQPDEFYRRLREASSLPSTSPPSRGEFLETYRRAVASGDVVSLHISAKLSETVRNAAAAVREGKDELRSVREEAGLPGEPEIRVVDSWQTSVGLGMMVVFAARMARRGLPLGEIVRRLEDVRTRCHLLFIVNTLEYLQRGGRIGKAQALLGTLLGIKPILFLDRGEVAPLDRVRGGRRVQPRLIEVLKERVDPKRPVFAAVAHASAPKWGARMRELLVKSFQIVELVEGEIGPIVGTHVGPGCVGASVFQPTEEEIELFGPAED